MLTQRGYDELVRYAAASMEVGRLDEAEQGFAQVVAANPRASAHCVRRCGSASLRRR